MSWVKTLMVKFAVPALALATTLGAQAGSIYQPGSEGDKLYKQVAYLLPDEVVPLFIPAQDKTRILESFDRNAYVKEGMSVDTVAYLMERVSPTLNAEKGVEAYAITGKNIPGNKPRQRFCGIVFTSEASVHDLGVLTHETIHCKNAFVNGTDEYKRAVYPAWKLAKNLTPRQFMALLDEAVAGGIQVSLATNSGKTAGLQMVKNYAGHEKNGVVSIGYRTARKLLEVCSVKSACPTDTIGMINKLVGDKAMLEAVMTDMAEIQVASEKAGLVVSDQ